MFDKLLESRARVQSRGGSSVAAIAIHAAIIMGAVVLTANAAIVERELVPEKIVFSYPTPPALPPEILTSHAPAVNASSTAEKVPLASAFVAPVVIPDLVLNLDARTASHSDIDFSHRSGVAVAPGPGGSGASGISSGDVFSELEVDRPVVLSPGAPAPIYPSSMRDAAITGDLIAEFVVDTLGRADMASLKISGTDRGAFELAVRRVLPEYRFRPAEYGGRRVRQRVQIPFRFLLDRQQ